MINVAVTGCGYWGSNLVRVFDSLKDANLKLVCDPDRKALDKVLDAFPHVSTTPSFDDVLADDSIDAVILSLPAPLHAEYAMKSLGAGKHTFVEKPLALSVGDAESVARLASESGLVLAVGHLLIHHPAVQYLKKIVDSGELGEIYYIYTQRLNLGKVRAEENAFWSLAPHDISILLYLLDETPVSVSATGESYIQDGIEDTVFAHLKFGNRKMGHLHVSWLDPCRVRRVTVIGEKKMVIFDDVESVEKIKIFDKGVERPAYDNYSDLFSVRFGDVHIPHIKMSEPLMLECRDFVDCVINGTSPRTGAADGLEVVRVLAAAQESLDKNGLEIKIS